MTSDRQIAANQSNAQKSTGPRSKAGREVARQNARRHGLAVDIRHDPEFLDGIEKLARALSGGAVTIPDHTREIAEAELDLLRIRKFRAGLFEALYFAETALPDGLLDLTKNLSKLERYERRAFSRRKSALRAMSENSGIAMVDATSA